ncbi:MAG: molybdenum cofactor guanylyltransferase [Pirellulaceae bacterium]
MVEVPAYVLAGGLSARFGSDKALVEIEGEVQLLRLLRQLGEIAPAARGDAHVVADRVDRYQALGITCLVDARENGGPLAGLVTALQHRLQNYGEGWLLLVNCDQVVWQAAWLAELLQHSHSTRVVCFCEDDRVQPLPGLYHSGVLPFALQQLSKKDLSLKNLLSQVPSATIATGSNPRWWSFNTLEELQRISLP